MIEASPSSAEEFRHVKLSDEAFVNPVLGQSFEIQKGLIAVFTIAVPKKLGVQ
jgi:hypothetical protein